MERQPSPQDEVCPPSKKQRPMSKFYVHESVTLQESMVGMQTIRFRSHRDSVLTKRTTGDVMLNKENSWRYFYGSNWRAKCEHVECVQIPRFSSAVADPPIRRKNHALPKKNWGSPPTPLKKSPEGKSMVIIPLTTFLKRYARSNEHTVFC